MSLTRYHFSTPRDFLNGTATENRTPVAWMKTRSTNHYTMAANTFLLFLKLKYYIYLKKKSNFILTFFLLKNNIRVLQLILFLIKYL